MVISEIVESHQPIVDALGKDEAREAALLMRNYVETFLECLRKSESDSGIHRAIRKDLAGAKEVQQSFFPPWSLSIPCISLRDVLPTRDTGSAATITIFSRCPKDDGESRSGMFAERGSVRRCSWPASQASLKAQVLHPHLDLSTLIGRCRIGWSTSVPEDSFATLFMRSTQPATRVLKYVNAGHNAPVVVRPRYDSCEMYHLESGGQPIWGFRRDSELATTIFQFRDR